MHRTFINCHLIDKTNISIFLKLGLGEETLGWSKCTHFAKQNSLLYTSTNKTLLMYWHSVLNKGGRCPIYMSMQRTQKYHWEFIEFSLASMTHEKMACMTV